MLGCEVWGRCCWPTTGWRSDVADSTERVGATPQRPSREPLRAYAVMRTVHALESLAFRPMSALTCQREAGRVHLFPESTDWR